MVFAIPSLEKVREMGTSEDDKEDLEVSLCFPKLL